jgi:DNA-binding GntR family transcriptional regulator
MRSNRQPTSSQSLERKTLVDRVYEILREDILNNRLTPDAPLQEAVIARNLGVSRGPVREALQRLSSEGLVEIIAHRGAVVTSLTLQDFLDAYRVRESLEALATQLATTNLTGSELDTLQQLHEEMIRAAETESIEAFFAANAQFHNLLVRSSKNRMLIEIYFPLIDQMRRYRMKSLTLRGGMSRSCDEHKAILDAIKARDADKASQFMRAHIRTPQRILESENFEDEFQLVSNNPRSS